MHYTAAALAGLGMVASVSAAGHNRHANLHNRHDKWSSAVPAHSANSTACGCKTWTSTWYGEGGLVPATSTSSSSSSVWTSTSSSTSSSTWVAPTTSSTSETPSSTWVPPPSTSETPSSTWVPPPSTSAPAPSSTYWAPESSSAPAPSTSSSEGGWGLGGIVSALLPGASSTPNKGSNGGAAGITSNGDKWAMTYTPYDNAGQCKSASAVADDVASIKSKGFTTVRLYATDCSGIQNVGSACKQHGMKMIMGIYIDASGLSNGYAQIDELTAWGSSNGWDSVEMVVAGNEAIFNGYCSASELVDFIGTVKAKFSAAGYSGPVTTTETLDIIQQNSGILCPAVDVIAANIHPFFNNAIDAAGAGAFVSSQLSLLADACGGSKEAYNLETGWPSAGDANGAAVPGVWEQQVAVESIISASGSKSAIFSFENDGWKAPGSLGVEQFWGCASLFQDLF